MHDRHPNPSRFDAVIAGAGPVGLFLTCELRRAAISVLVSERAETPHSPPKKLPFGMRPVHPNRCPSPARTLDGWHETLAQGLHRQTRAE